MAPNQHAPERGAEAHVLRRHDPARLLEPHDPQREPVLSGREQLGGVVEHHQHLPGAGVVLARQRVEQGRQAAAPAGRGNERGPPVSGGLVWCAIRDSNPEPAD